MTGTGRRKGQGGGCVAEPLAAGRRVGDAQEGGRKTELQGALNVATLSHPPGLMLSPGPRSSYVVGGAQCTLKMEDPLLQNH